MQQAQQSLAEAQRAADLLAEGLRTEAERDEALASEQNALLTEIDANAKERAAALARVQGIEERQRAAEAAMAEIEGALLEGQEAREKLSEAMAELRVQLAALEGASGGAGRAQGNRAAQSRAAHGEHHG